MITEDYVSFETARLLKEKGFNVPDYYCSRVYSDKGTLQGVECVRFKEVKYISAPTLQMAMKWLREEHNIAINIGWGEVFEDKFQWWCIILNYKDGSILRESEYYATREEACEEAIRYCLEHLI